MTEDEEAMYLLTHDVERNYWDNGQVKWELYMLLGTNEYDGPLRQWGIDGNLRIEYIYKNGIIKVQRYYSPNGELTKEDIFE
jgi:antitoxin component YwqK of YwqJK toxin-antitoxin module